ncbi:MAG: HEAT repeat domain-containing protein [Cyanobacteria bacterium P01_E01_bin.42]
MTDWTAYLDSVCEEYSQWWDDFTVTDVERIEEARSPSEREKKVERLGVLAGLRKYAKERVLLIGVPGSGKSTALRRLVLEVAQEVKEGRGDRIPVLVELRSATESIFKRIVKEIKKRDRRLKINERVLEEELLYNEKFLLLFDGLNELPSEDVKTQLQQLEADYPDIWMVFTTRNLGNAGIVNVEKQLTMQPLTEEQMKIFVRKQQQGEQILQQLGSRLRKLGKTPMFLWMLCKTVRVTGEMPRNAGELLDRFVLHEYERGLKQDIAVGDLRECWQDLLEELAFAMMPRKERLNIRLVFSRKEAEVILEQFLEKKGESDRFLGVKKYVKGLLKYHLLQIKDDDELEFHHQLIQEYYAAMRLKWMVSELSDKVLQQDYLNLFEWTEAIALMLGLLEDEEQAVRVVKLALAVDWQLGARLAGAVKREFQGKTVALVSDLDVSLLVKIELWGMTRSDEVVDYLTSALQHEYSWVRKSAAKALGNISTEVEVEALISALQDESVGVQENAAKALGNISTETRVKTLISILQHENSWVRWNAALELGRIGSDAGVEVLISALKHGEDLLRRRASRILGNIDTESAVAALISALQDRDSNVCINAVESLGMIGTKSAVAALIAALQHEDDLVLWRVRKVLGCLSPDSKDLIFALQDENFLVRIRAASILGRIGKETSENALISALEDEDFWVRLSAAKALGSIGSDVGMNILIDALQDEDFRVRSSAAEGLKNLRSESAVEVLTSALHSEDSSVRLCAVEALGKINKESVEKALISVLKDEYPVVRERAVEALGRRETDSVEKYLISALKDRGSSVRQMSIEALRKMKTESAEKALIFALQDECSWVRRIAVESLEEMVTEIGKETRIKALIFALQDKEFMVRKSAVEILGRIGSEVVEQALIFALQDKESMVRGSAADALGKIGSEAAEQALIFALQDECSWVRWRAVDALRFISTEVEIEVLIVALKDENFLVRQSTVVALGEMGTEVITKVGVEALIFALQDKYPLVRRCAAEALGKIIQLPSIPRFLNILKDTHCIELLKTIAAIQARAKYYNYALTLPTSTPDPQERAKLENVPPSPNLTLPMSETPQSLNFPNAQNVNVNYISGHGGHHTYNFAQTQDLETAIAELKKQLQELQEKNPNATEAEILQEAIQNNSIVKNRLLNALKQGGLETLNTLIPGFSILRETILGFLQNDPDREVRQIATDAISQLQEQDVDDEEQNEIDRQCGSPEDYEGEELIDMTDWVKNENQTEQ